MSITQSVNKGDLADEAEGVEVYAAGFLKGVMKVVGYSVLAVIAGYSAGIALDNCQTARSKNEAAVR